MGPSVRTYILVSPKSWHTELFANLSSNSEDRWIRISTQDEFTYDNLLPLQPEKIFIPHWSYLIPAELYNNWECILFHMTDLPFGRGGSPLQNLIVNGLNDTKISAIKVKKGIDTGDVYLKKDLSLDGTAAEIFRRANPIIEKMIIEIIDNNLQPAPQTGEPVYFQRRKPEESNIENLDDLSQIYDFIRMLDCEGYPNAFIETKNFRINFSDASLDSNNQIINAHVGITKK